MRRYVLLIALVVALGGIILAPHTFRDPDVAYAQATPTVTSSSTISVPAVSGAAAYEWGYISTTFVDPNAATGSIRGKHTTAAPTTTGNAIFGTEPVTVNWKITIRSIATDPAVDPNWATNVNNSAWNAGLPVVWDPRLPIPDPITVSP